MEKLENVSCSLKENKCSFCCNPSAEIKLVLKIAIRQLEKILGEKKYAEMVGGSQQNNGAMGRLLRIMFDQQQFELKLSKGCSHSKLRNFIKEKLKCRSDQLECIMEDLCDRIARRHYQLQIIALQIKNVQNSIIDLDQAVQTSHLSAKRSSNEGESEGKVEDLEKKVEEGGDVKIEQQIDQSIMRQIEGSPPTGQSYPLNFGEMPYSYNFLFYGPYYQ